MEKLEISQTDRPETEPTPETRAKKIRLAEKRVAEMFRQAWQEA